MVREQAGRDQGGSEGRWIECEVGGELGECGMLFMKGRWGEIDGWKVTVGGVMREYEGERVMKRK
jgi:hypothetical protein